jgi:predicted SAM-dependent methyltransferase
MVNVEEALSNWIDIVKNGGYIIIAVPDEDLYEQGMFPSQFNRDHKWTFTISKEKSWSPKSINVLDLFKKINNIDIIRVNLVDTNYNYNLMGKKRENGRYIDQTLPFVDDMCFKNVETIIEIVAQKKI